MNSCGSAKRYAYMQDVELAKRYSVDYEHKLVVEPGDRIRVAVQSDYPELFPVFLLQIQAQEIVLPYKK